MTSDTMCLTVLSHVLKDSKLHLIRRGQQAATAVVVTSRLPPGDRHVRRNDGVGSARAA